MKMLFGCLLALLLTGCSYNRVTDYTQGASPMIFRCSRRWAMR